MRRLRGPDGRSTEFNFQSEEFWRFIRRYCVGIVSPKRDPGEAAIEGLWLCYVIDLFATDPSIGLSRGQIARYRHRARGQVGRILEATRLLIKHNFARERVMDDDESDLD